MSADQDPKVLVVALDMGYGHLRAATPLAQSLETGLYHADRAPLADEEERQLWGRTRRLYELTSRASQLPIVGPPLRTLLEGITFIPHLHPYRDLSAPTTGARTLARSIQRGLGRGMVERLRQSGETLLTTFFAPAIIADAAGLDRTYSVVTDTDINRVWAPIDARASRIRYLVPSHRAARRLRAYGVPPERIHFTGFPLPHALVGGPGLGRLKRNLASRLLRLDPAGAFVSAYRDELNHFLGPPPDDVEEGPPRITFAVGGAGAQAGLARTLLRALKHGIVERKLRLTLVAGIRRSLADRFRDWIDEAGLASQLGEGVEILEAADHADYFERFDALLAETDALWTKPSELTFFGALGLPLIFSWPVGVHERYNRRWALESGAGLKQGDVRFAGEWLSEWLADGTLAAAAWSGFMRLPKFGLYRILEAVGAPAAEALR